MGIFDVNDHAILTHAINVLSDNHINSSSAHQSSLTPNQSIPIVSIKTPPQNAHSILPISPNLFSSPTNSFLYPCNGASNRNYLNVNVKSRSLDELLNVSINNKLYYS